MNAKRSIIAELKRRKVLVPRAITLVLLIGFPIAVVMAWIYDVTPRGSNATQTQWLRWRRRRRSRLAPPPWTRVRPPRRPASRKSIAVLPFTDLSPQRDQEYFSDGIAEEILDALVKLKDLKVAGRTSSFSFRKR